MSLGSRDRANVNAALLELHAAGADYNSVLQTANAKLQQGTPARQAYEYAFDRFAVANPQWAAPLQRIGQLIDASDTRTVASYNVAMTGYIATGDGAHLEAIAPTLRQDMAEMARRTGDAGFADNLPPNPAATAPAAPAGHQAGNVDRPGWSAVGFQPANVDPTPQHGPARARPTPGPVPPSGEAGSTGA